MEVVVVIDEVDVAKEPPGRWTLSERVKTDRASLQFVRQAAMPQRGVFAESSRKSTLS